MLKKLFIISVILCFAQSCFAATAGNTSDPKVPYGDGIMNMEKSGFGAVKVSLDADWIINRDLDAEAGTSDQEIRGEWYLCRIGYTFFDRIEPYAKFGMSHLIAKWKQGFDDIKVKGENAFAVGGGGKVLVFEIPEHRIRFSLNGQYLFTDPDIEEAHVNNPNRTVSATEFEVSEWQIGGMVSMELILPYDRKDTAAVYSLIPYVGGAYVDSNIKAKFAYLGTNYSLDDAENEHKILIITGCDIVSPQNVSLNAEGRWLGETAVSGGATFKF